MIALLAVVLLGVVLACWAPFTRHRRSRVESASATWAVAHHLLLLITAVLLVVATFLPEDVFRRYPDQFDPKSTFLIGGILAFIPLALFSLGLELAVTFARSRGVRTGLIIVLWVLSLALLLWLASPYLAT